MTAPSDVVFLFDVDNTLLDNDAAQRDYHAQLVRACGIVAAERYWAIFEQLRRELGYADYLGAFQRFRLDPLHDPRVLLVSGYLLDYPFADRVYAGALDVLAHFAAQGLTVIFTDGDAVFQPRKIDRAGIRQRVGDRVLVHVHKEQELASVERLYPAVHYVFVDDKLRLLTAVKKIWGSRVTTVFPRQGHYALDAEILADNPPADVTVNAIAELLDFDVRALIDAATRSNTNVDDRQR